MAAVLGDLEERASYGREIPGSIGFYLGEASAQVQRAAAAEEPTAASPPILDLAWLDQLPEPRRTEAHAAWRAKTFEVEAEFAPGAIPRVLASCAELLRQEFTKTNQEATA